MEKQSIIKNCKDPSVVFNESCKIREVMRITATEVIFNKEYTIDQATQTFIDAIKPWLDNTYGQKVKKLEEIEKHLRYCVSLDPHGWARSLLRDFFE